MGKNAGAPVKRAPVNMFRLFAEDTDLRVTTVGELKNTASVIETFEGGINTLADQTISMLKAETTQVTRPLTEDRTIIDWFANQRAGLEDKRNCFFVQLDTAGNDLYRISMEECLLIDHSIVKGDAKAGEEQQMETFTLKPRVIGDREDLQ